MRRLALLFSLLLGLALVAGPAQAAAKPLPVQYDFIPGALFGGIPGSNAPGTNDWSCKPTAAHPNPVVLVHGTLGNRSTNWQTYGPLLKNNGYCVFALTYGSTLPLPYPGAFGGLGDIPTSAAELGAFVDQVLAATGADKVDIVGHSQGTLMPDYWIKFLGGAGKVGSYISLSPLWHGTELTGSSSMSTAAFAPGLDPLDLVGPALGQMSAGSAFITKLTSDGGVQVPGINYVNIMTKYDELVKPYTSGFEPGMTNIVLQDYCKQDYTEHFEMAADKNASIFVLNALDPAHPRPLVCSLVLPFVGGL
ncbi:MAG TPA: alpha/beta fold hydrolase [Marmoricola sp.]|nr:alpha/beta fold hydrolase [Marmoricola sp.]